MATKDDCLLMAQYDLESARYSLELADEHGLVKRVGDIEQEIERIYYKEQRMESKNVADHIERVSAERRKALLGAYNLIWNAHSKLSRSGRRDLADKLYEAIEAVREAALREGGRR